MKLLLFFLGILIIISIAFAFFEFRSEDEDITIKQTYMDPISQRITKIIYTTTEDIPLKDYEGDCESRGGLFQECGDPCEPNAPVCETVCAVTCTFPE